MLLYDRFGVGETTDRNQCDACKVPAQRHHILEAMRDLPQRVFQISEMRLGYAEYEINRLKLRYTAYSIGCYVA
jgi:hypothetical protein